MHRMMVLFALSALGSFDLINFIHKHSRIIVLLLLKYFIRVTFDGKGATVQCSAVQNSVGGCGLCLIVSLYCMF